MAPLTHDEFFTKLTDLFNNPKSKSHGTVFLTQKRLSPQPTDTDTDTPTPTTTDPLADLTPPSPLPILVRATNGKSKPSRADKIKLSTVVRPDELEPFYARYAECCKAGMAALKPRDRKKGKAKARKRKGVGAGVV
ncbi:signal recognition particle, SRP9/SRP14 subunit [Trichocladium antarcticum]|uniref:Signal recognition particle subunit SRP14 n=1 Tax=Trichocladium antarcticum TaxID=1450529 RepID=A0AAN6UP80_9PEZI|nr:signal recognition particle, SRP9/SRP14 subunit [Trichocladium antarcticum]